MLYGVCLATIPWLCPRAFLVAPEISPPVPTDQSASSSKVLPGAGSRRCESCNSLFWIMSETLPEILYRLES
ncbi:hypothetical protein B0H14DRAFT_3011073 [Mycena olivaceomarginata]|nr:hypothetical protein B0H14DRAFT_3011073 [Mycena olivaceomarginata]